MLLERHNKAAKDVVMLVRFLHWYFVGWCPEGDVYGADGTMEVI